MLQYTQGTLDMHDSGNLFVHRFIKSASESRKDMTFSGYTFASSYSSTTYWKSPNSVETASLPKQGICFPPEMKVSSKFSHRPNSSRNVTAVKGILKKKLDNEACEGEIKQDVIDICVTPRISHDDTNEASISDTKVIRSSTKRVQFDALPNHRKDNLDKSVSEPKQVSRLGSIDIKQRPTTQIKGAVQKPKSETNQIGKPKTDEIKHVPFHSFYTLRRDSSARSLSRKYIQAHSDSNSKSQITDFIKKLRLVERAKLKRAEENIKHMEKLEKEMEKSSERLRRPRIKSAIFKSVENDHSDGNQSSHERAKSAFLDPRTHEKDSKENMSYLTLCKRLLSRVEDSKSDRLETTKDLLPSNSFLLSKTDSSGGSDKERRERAISMYTRHNAYRPPHLKLWKPNESSCYKDEQGKTKNLGTSKQTRATNYCDSGKTSQILGWLYDVTTARSEDPHLECVNPSLANEDTTHIEDEYIPSID